MAALAENRDYRPQKRSQAPQISTWRDSPQGSLPYTPKPDCEKKRARQEQTRKGLRRNKGQIGRSSRAGGKRSAHNEPQIREQGEEQCLPGKTMRLIHETSRSAHAPPTAFDETNGEPLAPKTDAAPPLVHFGRRKRAANCSKTARRSLKTYVRKRSPFLNEV